MKLSGLEGTLLCTVAGMFIPHIYRKLGFLWSEYKLARACPHPDHRIFEMEEGGEEYFCAECGYRLHMVGTDDL
jgi:hypothetical protein